MKAKMHNEEKREMIERALGPILQIFSDPENQPPQWGSIYDALAKQAFAVDCVVEHTFDRAHLYGTQFPMTVIKKGVFIFETLQGHHGTEGPALAIIITLEEEK